MHNLKEEEKHPKQDFQVERIAFFSDAVFAIALTLLIIEFVPPNITKDTTHEELVANLASLKYKFVALIVSFGLIMNYWIKHHTLFKHIYNYNKKIIQANMLLLLPVILFPFSTSFVYETLSVEKEELLDLPFKIFIFNNLLASVGTLYLYYTATNKFKEYCYEFSKEDKDSFQEMLYLAISFAAAFAMSFIYFQFAGYILFPFVFYQLYKKFKKVKSKKIRK